MKSLKTVFYLLYTFLVIINNWTLSSAANIGTSEPKARITEDFNKDWKFHLGDIPKAEGIQFDDSGWRKLNLPHDWSIEGQFGNDNPSGVGGGALPGGTGWYRKSFIIPENSKEKLVFVEFDGIYRYSEVWINNNYLGKRPNGYISFQYELTPFLKYGNEKNIIAVRVDNSLQPNTRWYSGSGIYRNVRLVINNKLHVEHWGTFITTPRVNKETAKLKIRTRLRNSSAKDQFVMLKTFILDKSGEKVSESVSENKILKDTVSEIVQDINVDKPILWSIENPYLYKVLSIIELDKKTVDSYETSFGIRTFNFDSKKGFLLNGRQVKIKGVCIHHDLGFLGAAVNKRAIERQLEIMKDMGVNGIRTAHNPPAPELLDLCDKMGFIVMDEAFDMWKKGKTKYDYSLDWDDWHKKDLEDMVLRDRNHPSVFIWSIGNEVLEQWDSTGLTVTKELTSIIRKLDTSRPITSNLNYPEPDNFIIRSGTLDLIGLSYHHQNFEAFPDSFPGQKFIGSETTSALATRGDYDMPSDSIRRWPLRWDIPFNGGNPGNTCSSYDNCSTPWGSTHEESWRLVKKHDFLSGMYIWTGFDYLGEPTPYVWPSRSSYFGIVDLAGFPKDAFYLYQSEWTDKPVLHIFPHWNWNKGDTIDVWVYTNCEEVELFLNGKSLGTKKKQADDLHLMWRLSYEPGTLKAIGKQKSAALFKGNGKNKPHSEILTRGILIKEVKTAGPPAKIILEPDRKEIACDGDDLSFITVKILDKDGILVPYANNLIDFEIKGEGKIAGVDNGLQTSHEKFKADYRKAFNGMCLVVVQSREKPGQITLKAASKGLEGGTIVLDTKERIK